MEGFYGVEIAVGRHVKPQIPEACLLRISQIALPAGATGAVTLSVVIGGMSYAIATLDPTRAAFHASADLVVAASQGVTFRAEGVGAVHLTGFIQPSDQDGDIEVFEDEDEDDYLGIQPESDEEEAVPAPKSKSKKKAKG